MNTNLLGRFFRKRETPTGIRPNLKVVAVYVDNHRLCIVGESQQGSGNLFEFGPNEIEMVPDTYLPRF